METPRTPPLSRFFIGRRAAPGAVLPTGRWAVWRWRSLWPSSSHTRVATISGRAGADPYGKTGHLTRASQGRADIFREKGDTHEQPGSEE